MVLVRVQYDAYNRQFTILDRDLVRNLKDGETYMVLADISLEDVESKLHAETQPELALVIA